MTNNNEQLHWLVRPTTIRKLWIGFIAVLALVVLAQTGIYIKGYFVVDGWFGFGAVYGFGCCLLMVLAAKLLGAILKRPEDYYGLSVETPDKAPEDDEGEPRNRIAEHSDGA
jgi:hypothetical protein